MARVARWRLGESSGTTAADGDGTYPGTIENAPTLGVAGAIVNDGDTAITFARASSQRIKFGDVLPFNGTASFAVKLWFKLAALSGNFEYFVSKYKEGSQGWAIYWNPNDNTLRFFREDGSGADQATVITSPTLNRWYHIIATYDGANIRVYLNGALVSTVASTRSIPVNTGEFEIAATTNAVAADIHHASVTLDEVEVFDANLDAAAVLANYVEDIDDDLAATVYDTRIAALSGVVGHWRHGETAGWRIADRSSNLLVGELVNGPTLGAAGALAGAANTSISYDGTNDYAEVPDAAVLDITSTVSLECWFYATAYGSTAGTMMMLKGDVGSATDQSYGFVWSSNSNGKPAFRIGTSSQIYEANSPSAVSLNAWHHVVGTYDGSALRLYIDGVLVDTNTIGSVTIKATTHPLRFAFASNGGSYFPGRLQDIVLYNTAVSEATILGNYLAGTVIRNRLVAVPMTDQATGDLAGYWDGTRYQKRAIGAAGTILSSLAGLPQYQTLSALIDAMLSGAANGDILTRIAGLWSRLGVGSAGQKLGVVSGLPGYSSQMYPKGHMEGLRLRYSSATAVIVEAGSCRNAADDGDLVLAAEATVPITTPAAFASTVHGIDETTLVGTATTHGTNTFEPSASLYAEAAMTRVVRTLTGTASTSGDVVTGTDTKFLTELAPGDVIRSATKGASRVQSIASDESCTLFENLPDGDATSEAFTCYENLSIWPDTAQAGDKRAVRTITHAGTSVTVDPALTSSRAGAPMKVGVEVASCWYFPWLLTNGTTTIVALSTQRTRPHLTGITSKRRIPCAILNNASGDIDDFMDEFGGAVRYIQWRVTLYSGSQRVLSGGASTAAWVGFNTIGGAPPTAKRAELFGQLYDVRSTSAGNAILAIRNGGVSVDYAVQAASTYTDNSNDWFAASMAPIALTSAGRLEYTISMNGTPIIGTPAYVDVAGWWEVAA